MQRRSKSNKLLCLHISGDRSGNSLCTSAFCVGRDIRSTRSVIVGNFRRFAIFAMFIRLQFASSISRNNKKFLGESVAFEVQYTNFIAFFYCFYNICPDWFLSF